MLDEMPVSLVLETNRTFTHELAFISHPFPEAEKPTASFRERTGQPAPGITLP
jgi:hypothetical protein